MLFDQPYDRAVRLIENELLPRAWRDVDPGERDWVCASNYFNFILWILYRQIDAIVRSAALGFGLLACVGEVKELKTVLDATPALVLAGVVSGIVNIPLSCILYAHSDDRQTFDSYARRCSHFMEAVTICSVAATVLLLGASLWYTSIALLLGRSFANVCNYLAEDEPAPRPA